MYHNIHNIYCQIGPKRWQKVRDPRRWFEENEGTSMLSSAYDHTLATTNNARFVMGLDNVMEQAEYDSEESYDY